MSSLSSVSGGSDIYSFLQSLTTTQSGQPTNSLTAPAGATSTTGLTSTSGLTQGTHHHHHGHKGGGESQLFQQIQQAVTGALQAAQQNGGADPNKTVQDAIAQVLKTNLSGSQSPDSDGDSDGSTSTAAGSSSAAGSTSPANEFLTTLKSYGIDETQFQQDFQNALQSLQTGSGATSSGVQGLAPGSLFDAIG